VYVPGDATATAGGLAGHAGLLRAGSVTELYLALADVVIAGLFWLLSSGSAGPSRWCPRYCA
jgi:hypothetical protein